VAAGLFVAFIPLPIQTICALAVAILLRGNVMIAAACTWISNPITFIPINVMLFRVGQTLTGATEQYQGIKDLEFIGDNWLDYFQQFMAWCGQLGKSILIGIPVVSISVAILGFLTVYLFWGLIIKIHPQIKPNNKPQH
jgi:uncharacterized protein